MSDQKQIDDSSFLEKYTEDKYINKNVIEKYGRVGVITDGCAGQAKEFTDSKNGLKTLKPFVVVQLKGKSFELTLSARTAKNFVDEAGSDRSKWAGRKVLFDIDKAGNQEFVKASMFPVEEPVTPAAPATEGEE